VQAAAPVTIPTSGGEMRRGTGLRGEGQRAVDSNLGQRGDKGSSRRCSMLRRLDGGEITATGRRRGGECRRGS
jgi:hypothetical protein